MKLLDDIAKLTYWHNIQPCVDADKENELVQYIYLIEICYGLTISDLCRLVYKFCEKNKVIHPFNKDNKMAGRDFIARFLTRHSDVSLRKPEATSLNRMYGLNKVSVDKYFENLAKVSDTYNLEPQQIFNSEASKLSCLHKPNKVLAQKGKQVSLLQPVEKEE